MSIEKDKLQKIVATCLGAICLSAGYYQFVIAGIQQESIAKLKKDILAFQTKLDKARANEKRLTLLTTARDQSMPFLESQESRIVRGDHVAWLWREMGNFAEKQKMARLVVVPENAGANGLPENESYDAATASLNMYCGYHKLGEFVRDLENSFGTLQIRHLEILGGSDTTPDLHIVRVQFQLLAVKEDKSKEEGSGEKLAQAHAPKE